MKKVYKVVMMIFLLIIIFAHNVIYASMADFTDEQADSKQKQEQEEWKKYEEERINKSDNNLLKGLEVKNYDITPTFDKQILNYEIEKDVNDNYIEITAETDDKKASLSGTGIIELTIGENNLRIDVTAENGTVRTYFIKVNCVSKEAVETKEKEENNEIKQDRIAQIQNEDLNKNNNNGSIIVLASAFFIVVVIAIFLILKKSDNKKHAKNKRKH